MGLPSVSSNTISQDSLLLEWILTQFDNNKTLSHHDVFVEALKLQCCQTSKVIIMDVLYILLCLRKTND